MREHHFIMPNLNELIQFLSTTNAFIILDEFEAGKKGVRNRWWCCSTVNIGATLLDEPFNKGRRGTNKSPTDTCCFTQCADINDSF